MHRSRHASFIIDCQGADLRSVSQFWSAALDMRSQSAKDDRYIRLDARARDFQLELQRVNHESRVHLDIETDGVEAKVELV